MKYDSTHGSKLSRALAYEGGRIIEQAGGIFTSAYHGLDMPLNGYEINEAERAACNVLDAIDAYRAATETKAADPPRYVPGSQGPHPRPGDHKQAVGMRAGDVLLDLCRCTSPFRHPRNDKRCSACGGHIYGRPEADASLAALNGDDTPPDQAA